MQLGIVFTELCLKTVKHRDQPVKEKTRDFLSHLEAVLESNVTCFFFFFFFFFEGFSRTSN